VDDFEGDQLVIVRGATSDEKQRSVSAVDYFGVWANFSKARKTPNPSETLTLILEEVAHPSPPRQHELRDILDNLGFVLRGQGRKPLRQALQGV
jgi:hypothetical protein